MIVLETFNFITQNLNVSKIITSTLRRALKKQTKLLIMATLLSLTVAIVSCQSAKVTTSKLAVDAVTGRAVTGLPVVGGVVRAYDLQGNEVSNTDTDASGSYVLSNLDTDNHGYLLVLQTIESTGSEKMAAAVNSFSSPKIATDDAKVESVYYFSILPKGHKGLININPFTSAVTLLYLTQQAAKKGFQSVDMQHLILRGKIYSNNLNGKDGVSLVADEDLAGEAGKVKLLASYNNLRYIMPSLDYLLKIKNVSSDPQEAFNAIFFNDITPASGTGVDGVLDLVTIKPSSLNSATITVASKTPETQELIRTVQEQVDQAQGQSGDPMQVGASETRSGVSIPLVSDVINQRVAAGQKAKTTLPPADQIAQLSDQDIKNKVAKTDDQQSVLTGHVGSLFNSVKKAANLPIVFLFSKPVSGETREGAQAVKYNGFIYIANLTIHPKDAPLLLRTTHPLVRNVQPDDPKISYHVDGVGAYESLYDSIPTEEAILDQSTAWYTYEPSTSQTAAGLSYGDGKFEFISQHPLEQGDGFLISYAGRADLESVDTSYCKLAGDNCLIKVIKDSSEIDDYFNNLVAQGAVTDEVITRAHHIAIYAKLDSILTKSVASLEALIQQETSIPDTSVPATKLTPATVVGVPATKLTPATVVETTPQTPDTVTQPTQPTPQTPDTVTQPTQSTPQTPDTSTTTPDTSIAATKLTPATVVQPANQAPVAQGPVDIGDSHAFLCHSDPDPKLTALQLLSKVYPLTKLRTFCQTNGSGGQTAAAAARPSVIKIEDPQFDTIKGKATGSQAVEVTLSLPHGARHFTNRWRHLDGASASANYQARMSVAINANGVVSGNGWRLFLKMPNIVVPGANTSYGSIMAAYNAKSNVVLFYGPRKSGYQDVEVGGWNTNTNTVGGAHFDATIFARQDLSSAKFECLIQMGKTLYKCEVTNNLSGSPAFASRASDDVWAQIQAEAYASRLISPNEEVSREAAGKMPSEIALGKDIYNNDPRGGAAFLDPTMKAKLIAMAQAEKGGAPATPTQTVTTPQAPTTPTQTVTTPQAPTTTTQTVTTPQVPTTPQVQTGAGADLFASIAGATAEQIANNAPATSMDKAVIQLYRPGVNAIASIKANEKLLPHKHHIIAYAEPFLLGGSMRPLASTSTFPKYISQLTIAFVKPDYLIPAGQDGYENAIFGDWMDGSDRWAGQILPNDLPSIIDQISQNHAVILGLGGWTYSATENHWPAWSNAAGKPLAQSALKRAWVNYLVSHHLDGLDVDYEVETATLTQQWLNAYLGAIITAREVIDEATKQDNRPRILTLAARAVQVMCTADTANVPTASGKTDYCKGKTAVWSKEVGALRKLFNQDITVAGTTQKVKVRDMIDTLSLMSYDAGRKEISPEQVYYDAKDIYNGPVNIGFEQPREAWPSVDAGADGIALVLSKNSDIQKVPTALQRYHYVTGDQYGRAVHVPYTIEHGAEVIKNYQNHSFANPHASTAQDGFMFWEFGAKIQAPYPADYPAKYWVGWRQIIQGLCQNLVDQGLTPVDSNCTTPAANGLLPKESPTNWLKSSNWLNLSSDQKHKVIFGN